MIILLIIIVAALAWGIRLIRIDLKILEKENTELNIANKELLEASYKLTKNKYYE
jgi:hypothetical protein